MPADMARSPRAWPGKTVCRSLPLRGRYTGGFPAAVANWYTRSRLKWPGHRALFPTHEREPGEHHAPGHRGVVGETRPRGHVRRLSGLQSPSTPVPADTDVLFI